MVISMTKQFLYLIIIILFAIVLIVPHIATAAQQQQVAAISSSLQNTNSSAPALTIKNIFKQVENSVVQITSKVPTALNPQSPNATALGSGFVYDNQGHIITNGHVVGDAKIVDVTYVDGNRYTAKVIANDIYSDIALLEISQNNTQQQQLPFPKPLVIGNSSSLEVGDQVIAIGNPFGLSDTMTTGIISG